MLSFRWGVGGGGVPGILRVGRVFRQDSAQSVFSFGMNAPNQWLVYAGVFSLRTGGYRAEWSMAYGCGVRPEYSPPVRPPPSRTFRPRPRSLIAVVCCLQ